MPSWHRQRASLVGWSKIRFGKDEDSLVSCNLMDIPFFRIRIHRNTVMMAIFRAYALFALRDLVKSNSREF
jgi:hypothetical protein